MTPLPREPSGSGLLVQTVRQLIRCLRERQIIPDPSVELIHTENGTRIKAKGGRGGGGGGGTDDLTWL